VTVTILAYLIVDLLILSISNNTVATISDIILALITVFLFRYYYGKIEFTDALVAAIVIGIGDWFFHKYMAKNVLPNRKAEEK
jgi:hypothetical protein